MTEGRAILHGRIGKANRLEAPVTQAMCQAAKGYSPPSAYDSSNGHAG